ncbi:MAG: hypothetical protein H8E12_15440 [Rhodobacteraceae bacterium]|nr:hypothetical protein [Paracoccaceae bacterium]
MSNSERPPKLEETVSKYRVLCALENIHQYFSEDDSVISEETLDLLEELFGKLKWRDDE